MNPEVSLPHRGKTGERVRALIAAACQALEPGASSQSPDAIHRLAKADTAAGLGSMQSSADLGLPYSMLLCECLLGRPFAGHRDSVSKRIGNIVENAVKDVLSQERVSYRKTKRAERLAGFDQAPDFVVPNEFTPRMVIKGKLTEDDGTAGAKVTRLQHLATLSMDGRPEGQPGFDVVDYIAGRGFGVRSVAGSRRDQPRQRII